jgi:hypothetical protein
LGDILFAHITVSLHLLMLATGEQNVEREEILSSENMRNTQMPSLTGSAITVIFQFLVYLITINAIVERSGNANYAVVMSLINHLPDSSVNPEMLI